MSGGDVTLREITRETLGAILKLKVAPSQESFVASNAVSIGATADAVVDTTHGLVTAITVTSGGSGYTAAPSVVITGDGTGAAADATVDTTSGPITSLILTNPGSGYTAPVSVTFAGGSGSGATATASIATGLVAGIALGTGAGGYTAPVVTIGDAYGTGTGATATATVVNGVITGIAIGNGGTGYSAPVVTITDPTGTGATADAVIDGTLTGGIRKFVDRLPGLTSGGANAIGQYIPLAVAETRIFNRKPSDYYEIALVEFSEKLHTDLPPTRLRGYVQLSTVAVPGQVRIIHGKGIGTLRETVQALLESGKALAELPLLFARPEGRVVRWLREVRGRDLLDAAVAAGKGVIAASPHLGSWEMAGLAYSRLLPIVAMYRPQREPWDTLLKQGRSRFGAVLVPSDRSGMRRLLEALRHGGSIGVLPDQDPPRGSGVFAPFFGVTAHSPVFASRLARHTGATILYVYAERLGWGRGYVLHVDPAPPGVTDEDEIRAVTAVNRGDETCVRRFPAQYYWAYTRFRRRPPGEPSIYPWRRSRARA